jgi:formylglycine-generating enzyme required for sulfatase activity/outer membrane protein assembly factor BamB
MTPLCWALLCVAAVPAADESAAADKILATFVDEFVPLTPGAGKFPASFQMGSAGDAPDAERPAFTVTFKAPFAVAKYEVTQELYEAVVGKNPSRWKGNRNSVEMVSWDEANAFCRKATAELRRRKLLKDDEVIRLPTEAEWEYACRAGSKTAYSFGDAADDLKDYAWFKGNAKGEDPPVGKKKPNAWGLYDMHGYVWEWCSDSWHKNYEGAPTDGTAWTGKDEKEHVLRGGSWADDADSIRSAFRAHRPADHRSDAVGFRCVRAAAPKETHTGWPQFLGPTRDGASAETGLLQTWDKKGPPKVWEKDVGEGYSSPVVVGERVILFHRVGDEDLVECLDVADGKRRWKYAYPTSYQDALGKGNGPRATPLVADGKVYTLGAQGVLLCLDLEKGTKVWSRELLKDYKVKRSYFGVGTSPLVEGDLLLVNVGGANGAGIVAFNKNDGKEVWKATNHDASYSSPVAATIDGVRHAIFFTREGIVSLDPANGAERFGLHWRSKMDASVNAATPLVVGNELFVSASYGTGAILADVKKDKLVEVWSNDQSLSCHFNTPVYRDGFLYGFDGREDVGGAVLRCVELKTGKVRWEKNGFGSGSTLLAEGNVILLSEDGDLVLLGATPDKYDEKAKATVLTGPVRANMALANGKLYARGDKKLACWNLKK